MICENIFFLFAKLNTTFIALSICAYINYNLVFLVKLIYVQIAMSGPIVNLYVDNTFLFRQYFFKQLLVYVYIYFIVWSNLNFFENSFFAFVISAHFYDSQEITLCTNQNIHFDYPPSLLLNCALKTNTCKVATRAKV